MSNERKFSQRHSIGHRDSLMTSQLNIDSDMEDYEDTDDYP